MTADKDRHGTTRCRTHLYGRDVENFAVELEEAAGHEAAYDGDLSSMRLPRRSQGTPADLVVLGPRARADAEDEAVVGQDGGRAHLFGDQDRLADRQLDHEGDEADALGDRTHGRDDRERLEEGFVIEELAGAVGVERVRGVGDFGVADGVGDDEGVESGILGGPGQGQVVRGLDHGLRIREPHATSPFVDCSWTVRVGRRPVRRLPCGTCLLILPGPTQRGATWLTAAVRMRSWRLTPSAPLVTDLSLEEMEREARQVIGEMAYAYYSGGADDERLLGGERGGVGALAACVPGSWPGWPRSRPRRPCWGRRWRRRWRLRRRLSRAWPCRGRGGDGPGCRGGRSFDDPVVAGDVLFGGCRGGGAGRGAMDADLRVAGPGADGRSGGTVGGARLSGPGVDRRRAGLGVTSPRMAGRCAPAGRPGVAEPGGRQHGSGARRWLHGGRDRGVRAGPDTRRRGVAGGVELAAGGGQGGATGRRRGALHRGGGGGRGGVEPRGPAAGRRAGDGRHPGRGRRRGRRTGRGLRGRRAATGARRGQGAGARGPGGLVGRPSLWASGDRGCRRRGRDAGLVRDGAPAGDGAVRCGDGGRVGPEPGAADAGDGGTDRAAKGRRHDDGGGDAGGSGRGRPHGRHGRRRSLDVAPGGGRGGGPRRLGAVAEGGAAAAYRGAPPQRPRVPVLAQRRRAGGGRDRRDQPDAPG